MRAAGRDAMGEAGGRVPAALGTWLGLAIWAGIAFAANLLTPLWADDWCRAGLTAPADILEAALREYVEWTGRVGPLAMTFLALGPLRASGLPLFEMLNALAFVALAGGLVALAGEAPRRFAGRLALSLAAGLLLWWVPNSIAEVGLWKTGAIGYLWPVAAAVLILGRVAALLRGEGMGRGRLAAWALATGFFATFLEPLSVTLGAALAVAAGWAWRRGLAGSRALMVLLLAQALGTLLLLLAPGNFERVGSLAPADEGRWAQHWYWLLRSLLDRYAAALLLLIAAGWIAAAWGTSLALPLPRLAPFLLFAICYLAVLLPLPAHALANRIGFPVSVALCGMGLVMLNDTIRRLAARRWRLGAAPAALALLLVAAGGLAALREVSATQALQRDFPLVPLVRPGQPGPDRITIAMPPEVRHRPWASQKSRYFLMPAPDAVYWTNRCLAAALGVGSVSVR